jgi:hypothetical protein
VELWFEEVEVEVEVFLAAVFFFFSARRADGTKKGTLSLSFSLSLSPLASLERSSFLLSTLFTRFSPADSSSS